MASGTIKAVASKADVNALNDQIENYGNASGNVKTKNTVDLNTVTGNGIYYCLGCTNIPSGAPNGFLQVVTYGTTKRQLYMPYSNENTYIRTTTNGTTWSSWESLSDNITPSSGTVTAASNVTLSNLSCKKSANIVTINGAAVLTGSFAGKDALIMTLPTGFRPSSTASIFVYTTYGGAVGMYHFWVKTDGTVVTQVGGNEVTSTVFFNVSFCI